MTTSRTKRPRGPNQIGKQMWLLFSDQPSASSHTHPPTDRIASRGPMIAWTCRPLSARCRSSRRMRRRTLWHRSCRCRPVGRRPRRWPVLHNTGKARFRCHATAIASASDAPFEDVFKSRVGEHNRWPAVGPGRRRTAVPLAAVREFWRSSARSAFDPIAAIRPWWAYAGS